MYVCVCESEGSQRATFVPLPEIGGLKSTKKAISQLVFFQCLSVFLSSMRLFVCCTHLGPP